MANNSVYELKEQIYLFPAWSNDGYIVYAPLKGACFWVNEEYGSILEHFLASEENISQIEDNDLRERLITLQNCTSKQISNNEFRIKDHLVLILSELCNFGCKYCYAKNAHCQDIISWDNICKAVDILLRGSSKTVRITFIGGGEPLVTFPLLMKTVDYVESSVSDVGKQVAFSLTTNGSLITPAHAEWLKKHHFRVSVSFDILPEIQDTQRPLIDGSGSFSRVDKGIHNLINAGIIPRFRSTITTANVGQMKQMVQFSADRYPEVELLHFEHVTDNIPSLEKYYEDYLQNFFDAKQLARTVGKKLTNSIITSLHQIKNIFCLGEFCVVPNGDFVTCHRVSSTRDPLYKVFCVGPIDSEMDKNLPIHVGQTTIARFERCAHCYAKWHCAGGCAYNRLFFSESQLNLLCRFTKELIRRELSDAFNH